jgi:hypothetical protein
MNFDNVYLDLIVTGIPAVTCLKFISGQLKPELFGFCSLIDSKQVIWFLCHFVVE